MFQRLRALFKARQWSALLVELQAVELDRQQNPELWYWRASAYCGIGQPERSFDAFAKAIALDPDSSGLRLEAIEALLAAGQWGAARANLDNYCPHEDYRQGWYRWLLARCETRLGSPNVAEQRLLQLQQDNAIDLVRLGIGLTDVNLQIGNLDLSRHCLEQLLSIDPDNEDALILKIELLRAHAVDQFDDEVHQILKVLPRSCRLQLAAAEALSAWMYLDQARDLFKAAVARFGVTGALGRKYIEFLGREGDIASLQQCLDISSDLFPPINRSLFMAEVLCSVGDLIQAEQLLAAEPESFGKHLLMRLLLKRKGSYQAAVDALRCALVDEPENPDLLQILAQDLMGMGRWLEGWKLYNNRFNGRDQRLIVPPGVAPRNLDAHPAEKDVLVFGEQGIGDSIMLASMIPDLCDTAQSVTLLVQPRLQGLFKSSFPEAHVITSIDPVQYRQKSSCYGLACLGKFFRLARADFPGSPFIRVPSSEILRWSEALELLGHGLKVGIAWQGGGVIEERRRRSIPLVEFSSLFELPGIHWVNLQYKSDSCEINNVEASHSIRLHSYPLITQDLEATSALTAALDLVITVQQTALHIAGSVGTRAWVLLPMDPIWRYGYEGSAMPWYNSVELFRQGILGDWNGPMIQIRERLESLVAERAGQNGPIS